MGGIWTADNKFRKWLDVEIAVCEAWAAKRKIPKKALANIKKRADFTVERIDEIAKERGIEASGYRSVMNCNADSGQMVFHIHLHMLGGRSFSWPPG